MLNIAKTNDITTKIAREIVKANVEESNMELPKSISVNNINSINITIVSISTDIKQKSFRQFTRNKTI